jgi:hypothetical protein
MTTLTTLGHILAVFGFGPQPVHRSHRRSTSCSEQPRSHQAETKSAEPCAIQDPAEITPAFQTVQLYGAGSKGFRGFFIANLPTPMQ